MSELDFLFLQAQAEAENEQAQQFCEKWAEDKQLGEVLLKISELNADQVKALLFLIQLELQAQTEVTSASIHDTYEGNGWMDLPVNSVNSNWQFGVNARLLKMAQLKAH